MIKPSVIAILLAAAVTTAFAVGTSHWVQTSESDFSAGTMRNVVVTNLGDLRLSRDVRTLAASDPRVSVVHALAEAPDGTVYVATGPQGIVLSIKDARTSTAADLGDNVNVLSLCIDRNGALLVGTGGDRGRLLRIDNPGAKPVELYSDPAVQYVWSIVQTTDGNIYAATGPEGWLVEIGQDGKASKVFDSEQSNLLSMTTDGNDLLYIGTDPDGLVYRFNRKTRASFVLYDADESEVSALVLDGKGNLFAATAESTASGLEEVPAENASRSGRVEPDSGGVPLPTEPPKMPEPPQPTPPGPNEPRPIPKMMSDAGPFDPPSTASADQLSPDDGAAHSAGAGAVESPAPAPNGNAIYRIDRDGFVTQVFRRHAMFYSMVLQNGRLIVGSGPEGVVYQIDPGAEESTVLAKVDAKEVVSMLPARDGRVLLGLANSGSVASMSPGFAPAGTYTSAVLDATQISRIGKIHLTGKLPDGSKLTVSARSGNLRNPAASGWSEWSADKPAAEFVQTDVPPGRFFQYRLGFSSESGQKSAVVDSVDVAYQMPNVAPEITSITVTRGNVAAALQGVPGNSVFEIAGQAQDANIDDMRFSLHYRNGSAGPWIILKEDLTEPTWSWDTRGIPDGKYEVRLTATDEPSNPKGEEKSTSRISDPVLVDNTPPTLGDVASTVDHDRVSVKVRAVDRSGAVARLEYSVDSGQRWRIVLPSDSIADSPDESYSFDIDGLKPGEYRILLRATDSNGNASTESIVVTTGRQN